MHALAGAEGRGGRRFLVGRGGGVAPPLSRRRRWAGAAGGVGTVVGAADERCCAFNAAATRISRTRAVRVLGGDHRPAGFVARNARAPRDVPCAYRRRR